ncbi:hypothetical protein C0992_003108 [Termitomyces sp. T32_za158]|nr:hypothetical protein C0992_003108 [Termitomyces sp. T32_za158]
MPSDTQCALDNQGNLKDATDIEWFNDPNDKLPINPIAATPDSSTHPSGLRCGTHKRDPQRLFYLTAADKLDNDGNLQKKFTPTQIQPCTRPHKSLKKSTNDNSMASDDDSNDENFTTGSEGSESNEDSNVVISNSELADSLPSKSIPSTGRFSGKQKRSAVILEEVEDVNSAQNISERSGVPMGSSILEPDEVGNKHYKCLHGKRKVITVTAIMKSNLTGLVKALKAMSGLMHTLYLLLKDRGSNVPIMQEEIDIALGKTPLDSNMTQDFISKLKERADSIEQAFQKQCDAARELWDQRIFEDLLTKWIVASDKPFDEVETPKFQDLLKYMHHSTPALHIPGRNVIKRQVMDLEEAIIAETKKMFAASVSIFSPNYATDY